MRDYEVVYIFKSDLPVEDLESRLERYHQKLTDSGGGEITAVEHWGKRQLAYPIQDQLNGYYVVAQFRCDPALLPEYERLLKLEEELLRYLVVLSEGELPVPPSARADEAEAAGRGESEPRRDRAPATGADGAETVDTTAAAEATEEKAV